MREPGSYLSEVVPGWPIVVMRDEANELHALGNGCAHRAGPLVDDDTSGRCRSLVCGEPDRAGVS